MFSSLFNSPHPNAVVVRYDLAKQPDHSGADEAELKARKYYLDLAASGDKEAKLMLKTHPRWRLLRWYRRDKGEIL